VPIKCVRARDVGAVGVGALVGLFELLGVAEQHEVARGAGEGEDLGERHLAGFVDEQVVELLGGIVAGPQPSGAADDGPSGRSLRGLPRCPRCR
jgi:hypothetical protein